MKGLNSRAVIDACRPYEWRSEFPDVVDVMEIFFRSLGKPCKVVLEACWNWE